VAKRHGKTNIRGARYEDVISEVIDFNTRKVQSRLYEGETKRTRETARLRSPDGKRVVLPPLDEVLPPEAVSIRKAADSGNLITDTIRERLSQDLRTALLEERKSGKPLYVQGAGKQAGRLNPEVVQSFEARITDTFDSYCRRTRNRAGGYDMPKNLHQIAVTEVGSAVSELKHGYTKRILALNEDLMAVKHWKHYSGLSKQIRPHHRLMNGKEVAIDEPFQVPLWIKRQGKWVDTGQVTYMQHPHDKDAPASQVISCHCGAEYILKRKEAGTVS
jgi:hypothetical protein